MPAPTPVQITKPFGWNAAGGTITTPIPAASQVSTAPGRASYETGFPVDTGLPANAGGVNPNQKDFNGIDYDITSNIAALSGGQLYPFSSIWAAANGGYALGAVLVNAAGTGYWLCTVSGNTTNPDTGGAGWVAVITLPQTAQETANSSTPYAPQFFFRNGVNIQRYMRSSDTTQDNAFTQALASGYPLYVPAGTYLVQANHPILSGGCALWYGDGVDKTIIHVQATSGTPSLAGFTIQNSGMTFRDMTFQVDVNGHSSATAFNFGGSGTIKNTNFDNVKIIGVTTKTNNWGVLFGTVNVTGFYARNCWLEELDLAFVRNSADTTTVKDTRFIGCTFYNCSDGIEANSPNGVWTDLVVDACTFDSNSQFPAACANVQRVTIANSIFKNNLLEAIHLEAVSAQVSITGNHFVNNVQAATFGATADINIITGTHDVVIAGNTFDGTQNTAGVPLGVFTNAGSGGQPYSIVICENTFLCNSRGSAAVNVAACPSAVISNNVFSNPNSASLVQWFIAMSGATVTGSDNVFYTPAILLAADASAFGTLSNSRIDGTLTGWTAFLSLSGGAGSNSSINFNGFKIHRAFSVATSPVYENLFLAGTLFDGKVAAKFVQGGTATNWVETLNMTWDGTTFTPSGVLSNASGSNVSAPASGDWRVNGGNVQARCTSTVSVTGAVEIDFTGNYFA